MRDIETLQQWIVEFVSSGHRIAGSLRVLPQDAEDDGDSGLIKLELLNAHTTTVLSPPADSEDVWHVIFEARETDLALTAAQSVQLGAELNVAGALCAFLNSKVASQPDAELPVDNGVCNVN